MKVSDGRRTEIVKEQVELDDLLSEAGLNECSVCESWINKDKQECVDCSKEIDELFSRAKSGKYVEFDDSGLQMFRISRVSGTRILIEGAKQDKRRREIIDRSEGLRLMYKLGDNNWLTHKEISPSSVCIVSAKSFLQR